MSEEVDIMIPFGDEYLVLSRVQVTEALRRGRAFGGRSTVNTVSTPDRVLDADGMEAETKIPGSWFLEQARQGKIPHIRAGKYVRFELATVLAALRSDRRHADRLSAAPRKLDVIQRRS